MGAGQSDRAGLAISRDHRSIERQHGSSGPIGVQPLVPGLTDPVAAEPVTFAA